MLGAAVFVLLLLYGVASGALQPWFTTPLTVAPVFLIAFAATTYRGVPRRHANRYHALPPFAGGLVAITIVVGNTWYAGNLGWWIPAAFLSSMPFIGMALLHEGVDPGVPSASLES